MTIGIISDLYMVMVKIVLTMTIGEISGLHGHGNGGTPISYQTISTIEKYQIFEKILRI
jgi:hypothetical protein